MGCSFPMIVERNFFEAIESDFYYTHPITLSSMIFT